MDTFDFGKFLMENKLGAYSKAKLLENIVVASGDNRWIVDIGGMEYQAEYENHDEGDHIELRRVGNPKDIKSGTVKNVSEDGDVTIELDSTNDYAERRKANEAEMNDVIRGMGDDDDYDRKGDAERTGATFIPHTEPERSPSKFTRPASQQDLIKKLVNKMRILNRVAIDRYKYAKKEARPAAKEELHKAVKYMLGDSAKYTDEVMKGLLQPIHDEWARYAQSKATQVKPEGEL